LAKVKASKDIANHSFLDKTLAKFASNQKNFDVSAKHYASAYEKNTSNSNAVGWSKSVALNGDKKKAVDILEGHIDSLSEDKAAVGVKVVLAEEYISISNTSKAIEMYENILATNSQNVIALNNLSFLLLQEGKHKKSLAYAKRAIAIKGNNAAVLDTYATALVANKQLELAMKQYDKSISIDSSVIEVHINKAEALILNQQGDEAKLLLKSLKTNDEKEQARINQLLNGL